MKTETIPMPEHLEGRGPTLATINQIEAILRKAGEPLSVNEIKRRMAAKSVQHAAVRMTINHLGRYGLVVEGSKGVLWVPQASPQLEKIIRSGKRL